jgi:hypothetical protein
VRWAQQLRVEEEGDVAAGVNKVVGLGGTVVAAQVADGAPHGEAGGAGLGPPGAAVHGLGGAAWSSHALTVCRGTI